MLDIYRAYNDLLTTPQNWSSIIYFHLNYEHLQILEGRLRICKGGVFVAWLKYSLAY